MSNVNKPAHYNWHPAGIEARLILERMTFNTGNALKYIWRAKHKGEERQDLEKARNYIEREIEVVGQVGIEFCTKRLDLYFGTISAPFGDLSTCVYELLSAEFGSFSIDGKKHFLKSALTELNNYLEAMEAKRTAELDALHEKYPNGLADIYPMPEWEGKDEN